MIVCHREDMIDASNARHAIMNVKSIDMLFLARSVLFIGSSR
jgi:hypothetical protein